MRAGAALFYLLVERILTLHGVVFDIFVLAPPGTAKGTPCRVQDTRSLAPVPPHPALRADLSPQAGRGEMNSGAAPRASGKMPTATPSAPRC
jgi:hypothetical protein